MNAAEMTYYPGGPFIGRSSEDERFERLREDFLLDFGERTARAYKADLQDFLEWCRANRADPTAASPQDLRRYVASLQERGYAKATRTRRESTVRRFLQRISDQEGSRQ